MAQLIHRATARPPGPPLVGWRRRIVDPLAAFLAQGISPAELARAISAGTVCGVFPFLGATTLLTLGSGLFLRLNQPVMQAVNSLLSPVQLLLIPVFVHAGAWILGAGSDDFSVTAMLQAATAGSVMDFLRQFARAGWYALVAWLVAAPVIFALVYLLVAPLLPHLAAARAGKGGRS